MTNFLTSTVTVYSVLAMALIAGLFSALLRLWRARGRPLPFLSPRNPLWAALVRFAAPRLIAYSRSRPYFDLPGYMERHWIVKHRRFFPWSARIHKILRSDSDRDFHDHPWPYITVILEGGYTEVTPIYTPAGIYQGSKSTYYGPGSVLIRPAKHMHRLVLTPGTTATTLFLCGRWVQEWGFFKNPDWKTYWKDYLADEAGDKPRFTAPDQKQFLVCTCPTCRKLTYACRYNSLEDIERAKPDFAALIEADRNPFLMALEVGMNGRAIFPEWCSCKPAAVEDENTERVEEED